MIFNNFEYNEYGVCTNPDIPYQSDEKSRYSYKIEVSETPDGWVYGYNWSLPTNGGGAPCSLASFRKGSMTKSEAIVEAAKYLKERFEQHGTSKAVSELNRIIENVTHRPPKSRQLTIFDYL